MLTPAASYGSGLNAPEGVARGGGWLAIADTGNHQLVLLDVASPAAAIRLGARGTSAAAEGFLFPTAVAFAAPDQLYVADSRNRHLDHYALANGAWSWRGALSPFGTIAPPVGDLLDVVATGAGSLLVLDALGRVLAVDLAAGTASVALADARWKRPRAIATGAGQLYVADADAHLVYAYDAAFQPTHAIGGYGPGPGGLRTPLGVAVDAGAGRLYVTQGVGAMISAFDLAGAPLDQLALPATLPRAPRRCAVDAAGALVVADAAGNVAQEVSTAALAAPATDRARVAFGTVALGYSTVLPVTIDNPTADAVTVQRLDVRGAAFTLDPSAPAAPIVIGAGAAVQLLLRFAPVYKGVTVGELLAGTDSLAAPLLHVALSGEGAGAAPVAVGVVVDTSGSMDQPGGTLTKIERLRQAASLMTELLSPAGSNELSVTSFSTTASLIAPRAVLAATTAPGVESAIAALAAGGATSIGAGLQSALADLAATTLDRVALLVMTDGLENTAPMIANVVIPPSARVYTVGLGLPQYVDAGTLQSLASTNGGYFQVTDGDDLLLSKFFVQVFGDIVGDDVAFDPPIVLHAGQPFVADVDVTRADHAITAVLAWENAASVIDLELVSPAGQVIPLARASWAVQRARYVAARLDLRTQAAGRWQVRVRPTTVPAAGERAILTVLARSDDAVAWSVQGRGEKIAWSRPVHAAPTTELASFPDRARAPVAPGGLRRGDVLRIGLAPTRPAHGARILRATATLVPPAASLAHLRSGVAHTDLDTVREAPPKPLPPREGRTAAFTVARDRRAATADLRCDGTDGVYQLHLVGWLRNRFGEPFRRERSLSVMVHP